MKHETEHLIRVSPDESSQIEERRQSQASVSLRDKAAAYDLLHDAVEGNPFQRLGRLNAAIERLEDYSSLSLVNDVRAKFDLLELCLQRYATALVNAMVMDVAKQQYSDELINRSPEAMRRCERTGHE